MLKYIHIWCTFGILISLYSIQFLVLIPVLATYVKLILAIIPLNTDATVIFLH